MKVVQYIRNSQQLNADSIQQLRRLLKKYPYFQSVRLLLLQNLYQTQNELFETELRRSSVLLNDRSVLFQMIEGEHYELKPEYDRGDKSSLDGADRMTLLIDSFLEALPDDVPSSSPGITADASTDYMAFMLQQEDTDASSGAESSKGSQSKSRMVLSDREDYEVPEEENAPQETFFTETLAKIFIKQQKYERALEIIRTLSADNPKKNAYFADQIQFLEKLIDLKTIKK